MLLAALLGGLLLWLTFGGKVVRDRRNWPVLAAMIVGLALLARGEFIPAAVLVGGGAFWLRRPKRKPGTQSPAAPRGELAEARDLLLAAEPR